MAESPVYGLLHAYALGCLTKEDVIKLKDYIRSGSEFEWAELGEFQNLAAMLPAILNIETPPQQLKDKVARKLYSIREEKRKTYAQFRKTQITETESPVKPAVINETVPEVPTFNLIKDVQDESETQLSQSKQVKPEDFENLLEKNSNEFNAGKYDLSKESLRSEPEISVPVAEAPANVPAIEEKPAAPVAMNPILERLSGGYTETEPNAYGVPAEKSRKGLWSVVIILLLLVLALGAGLYYMFMMNRDNSKEIEKLRQQINSQTSKTDSNSDLIAILNSKEFKIADLRPADESSPGYGKIIMSYDLKIAYFQFAELPEPASGKTYQLWANIGGSYLSLGQFTPKADMSYEPLPKLPVIDKDLSVSFILTEEKAEGAVNPSNKVFLSGKI